MGVSRFEELIAWQKAKVLCIEVYKVFEHSKDFGFKDQIQRASVSIMNNIAEGSSIKRKVIKFESFSVDTTDSKAKSKEGVRLTVSIIQNVNLTSYGKTN